ncbi:hypothetical protein JJG63_005446, partial [Salmonella enterica subsp. enterica serovar 4,[5],12:b:-]|nr:hypothetical protein [Salmonella enterica subsp. enterica serovar 4,[5],12:b:-]
HGFYDDGANRTFRLFVEPVKPAVTLLENIGKTWKHWLYREQVITVTLRTVERVNDKRGQEVTVRHGGHGNVVTDDTDNPRYRFPTAGNIFFKKVRDIVVQAVICGTEKVREKDAGFIVRPAGVRNNPPAGNRSAPGWGLRFSFTFWLAVGHAVWTLQTNGMWRL